jgi:hypothetical protein
MDLFDTLTFAKILVRTTFLGTLSLTVPLQIYMKFENSGFRFFCPSSLDSSAKYDL